jgi:hypothetical protein
MLVANDVSVAFFAIGLISLLALPLFLRLPPSAGTEMMGIEHEAKCLHGQIARLDRIVILHPSHKIGLQHQSRLT